MVGLLIIVVIVVVSVLVLTEHRGAPRGAGAAGGPARSTSLADGLRRAVEAGVLTEEQVQDVLAAQPVPGPVRAPGRIPVVGEALAYLGGAFVIVGAVVAVARVWDDVPVWARLVLVGAVAIGFSIAGAAVPEHEDELWWRLHGFLWLLSTAALALFSGLFAVEVAGLEGAVVALVVGGVAAADSVILWKGHDRPLQHLGCYAGLVAAVAGGVAALAGTQLSVALSLWALGAAWAALGVGDRLRRHDGASETVPSALIGQALGAGTVLVAAALTAERWERWSTLFGLATAIALITLGSVLRRRVLLASGVVGVFVFLPAAVLSFFAETVAVPLVLVLVGGALIGGVIVVARRWGRGADEERATGSRGSGASPPAEAAPSSRPPR